MKILKSIALFIALAAASLQAQPTPVTGVTKIINGSGVSVSPTSGTGAVTVSATGSGGTVTSITAGANLTGGTITSAGTIALNPVMTGITSINSIGFGTNALTALNSITSVALSPLTLATGTFGTAVTFASATGIPTFATGGNFGGNIAITGAGATLQLSPSGTQQGFVSWNGTNLYVGTALSGSLILSSGANMTALTLTGANGFFAGSAQMTTLTSTDATDQSGAGTGGGRFSGGASIAKSLLVGTGIVTGAGTPGGLGAAVTSAKLVKQVTGIADNTPTVAITVTIPNAQNTAYIHVTLCGVLGAGGAVGAGEAANANLYLIAVTRVAGVAAVASISSVSQNTGPNVAGATTCTTSATLSSMSGAVGATNTFTINVTVARGSNSSTNHACFVDAEVGNINASGVTIQ